MYQINSRWIDPKYKLMADKKTVDETWVKINDVLGGGSMKEKQKRLLNPVVNEAVAKILFRKFGTEPWVGYKKYMKDNIIFKRNPTTNKYEKETQ